MVDIEYANAYAEVLEILKYIPLDDYNKIPKSKIELFETNANNNYKFIYSPNKTLSEQNVSRIAKGIIAILFRDYWATDIQKEKIIQKQNYDRHIVDEQKKKFYSTDVFEKTTSSSLKNKNNEVNKSNLPIKAKKDNLLQKIIIGIKNCFNFKNK